MKRKGHFPTGEHRHIRGQKVVQRRLQPLAGDGVLGFHAHTKLVGMHPGIRAAAPLDIRGIPQHFGNGFLQHLLHRQCVFLNLPAVIPGPVVAKGQ